MQPSGLDQSENLAPVATYLLTAMLNVHLERHRHSSLEAAGFRNISANMKISPLCASWQQPLLSATGG
jgi:hypothetical protein